jgi:hypothetical protein
MRFGLLTVLSLPLLLAQSPNSPTIPQIKDVNPDLLKLVIEDQWDRGVDMFSDREVTSDDKLDWDAISKRDDQRRAAVRSLLDGGKLKTGKDYDYAALIFQHSPDTAGYLLAHVLAVTAVSKGNTKSKWLAAATIDRYLQSLNRPQVFGTQFRNEGAATTMEPYDRTAFSDAIRAAWCVVPLAEQDKILKEVREGKPMRGTGTACK